MMENNKELIRRALLGDQEAQEECTRRGIVLPCAFCGSENIVISNWGLWRVWCQECLGKSDDQLSQADAIKKWNTRPAPPVGRCCDCKFYSYYDECCKINNTKMFLGDFCSYFKPREE
ncbi:Lar family restriction alleviation protein [Negativibacillus massiliensis]|uniref:Lar family restriction alleviation protein n=1 Tax=Negativibacillus massiliensis TaxID=1871035 RepID=UPI003AF6F480